MDHVLRAGLARELHARPFLRIGGSIALAHFAVYSDGDATIHEELLRSLCRLTGLEVPVDGTTHYSVRWNEEKQLKWERHTEFSTFTFVAQRHDADYFSDLPSEHVSSEWFRGFEGKRFVAIRMELVSGDAGAVGRTGVLRLDHPGRWLLTVSCDRRRLSGRAGRTSPSAPL